MHPIIIEYPPVVAVILFLTFVYKHYTQLYELINRNENHIQITTDILICYLVILTIMIYSVSCTFPMLGLGICGYLLLGMIE